MLTLYDAQSQGLSARSGPNACTAATVWVDLLDPTHDEDAFVEQQLGVAIPTRAEMREIEASSRFYEENGVYFMTASILHGSNKQTPETAVLTFILAGDRLVTVRYAEPRSFAIFLQRIEKGDLIARTGTGVMLGLLETMIDRAADYIERLQDEVERLAANVFDLKGGQQTRARRLDVILKGVGREGDQTSRAREAAYSLERLLTYFASAARARNEDPRVLERIDTAKRDITSLLDHARSLSERIGFLLNATLGMINIEQTSIIKIFSVAAVALMPPTLIASIYGMNFKHIPELAEPWGYPLALFAMLISAIGPILYFRRRGWF